MHRVAAPIALCLVLSVIAASLVACESLDTTGSGDSYSYVMGDLIATEEGTLPGAMEAARTVLESSGYRVTSFTRDEVKGAITGETSQGRSAQLQFEQMGLETVRIQLRIGVIGDRAESRKILDAIRLRL